MNEKEGRNNVRDVVTVVVLVEVTVDRRDAIEVVRHEDVRAEVARVHFQ